MALAVSGKRAVLAAAAALVVVPCVAATVGAEGAPASLRICADPNNLPFSNAQEQGFENRLAHLVADDLHRPLAYFWWPQRRGFITHTLKANQCDVVMGVPSGTAGIATTQPYYRSTYVFISRADRHLGMAAITDPRLHRLAIGVQLLGREGFNTPPAHALGEQGMVANVVGFPVYGDYDQPNPPARIIDAVAGGTVDIAAVWGPLGGYFAAHAPVPLIVTPITDTERFAPLQFTFAIAMGVRKGDDVLRQQLDDVSARRRVEIDALLRAYHVPLLALPPPQLQSAQADARGK
ncbi:MAG: substrate-binding domain-containing protein [Alphaproteobacteria bacterium]|nr:substrate-binding domain-containing protein [Alphaproteobacteria bacterium]